MERTDNPVRKMLRFTTWSSIIIFLVFITLGAIFVFLGSAAKVAQSEALKAWLVSPVSNLKIWQLLLIFYAFFAIFTPSKKS